MPDSILKYHFKDKAGNSHTVWKSDYDADPKGFAEAYPDARFEVVNRKTGDRGNVAVSDIAAAKKEGFDLFTASHKQVHKANAVPQQKAFNTPRKPMTVQEMQKQVAAEQQGDAQSYIMRPKSQMGKTPSVAPKNASPFVKSLYETDNAMKGADYPIDYTSPKAVRQVFEKNQQIKKEASRTAAKQNEWNRQNQPIYDNGTRGIMKTQGQWEKEIDDAAGKFVDANMGDYISKAILGEQKAAMKRGADAAAHSTAMSYDFAGLLNDARNFNQEIDPDVMGRNLSKKVQDNIQQIFSDPRYAKQIENQAASLGISTDGYIQSLASHLQGKLISELDKSELKNALPKNGIENFANRFISSNVLAKAIKAATQTRSQNLIDERAMAETEAGNNPYYKPSVWENVAADVTGMATDPIFHASAGIGGKVAGKVIGGSDKLGAILANGNVMQRLGLNAGQAVTSGGVTGFVFGFGSNAIQNVSTGEDTSMGGTLKAALHGGLSEAGSFATMGVAGVPLGMVGRSVGLKSIATTPLSKEWFKQGSAKIGLEAAKTWMEGTGMYLGGYVAGKIEGREQPEFNIIDGTIQSLPTAIGFRVQHLLKGIGSGRMKDADGKDLSWGKSTILKFNEFLTSDKAKTSRYLMSDDEKAQIFNSGAAKEILQNGDNIISLGRRAKKNKINYDDPYLSTDIAMVKSSYDKIMADPNVSWDAKAKFSAIVMGVMPSSRPMADYHTFTYEKVGGDKAGFKKYINEYSSTGELLSKISYNTAEQRDAIMYRRTVATEYNRFWNAYAALINTEKNDYNLQNQFFSENMKNWVDGDGNQEKFLAGMQGYKGSTYFDKYTRFVSERSKMIPDVFKKTSEQLGMSEAELAKAVKKDPLKRTDAEQNACVQLRKNFEKAAYPENKAHSEQSMLEGKDVARENNLGTDKPNPAPVTEELRNLSEAEDGFQAFMDSNDDFKQNYEVLKKQGLTNPQIYDAMVQQNGLTEEQLEPFARYINANARVQGIQLATQEAIEQRVEMVAGDWGFHGTNDGQQADGTQMLYVEDNNGRTLIVGSGDVAYDPTTGKPKEGVGDMLVCLDVQTREPVYVKVEDTTLATFQNVEDFKNEERQRLQQINSEPYNQAAQEQAARDANKPQSNETDASKQNEHSTQGSERDLNATIDKARSGDKESQDILSSYGIDWGTQGVYRFVNEGEANSVLNGETYQGRGGDGRVDVTASQDPTTAANADYRITFKPEHDLYKEEGNGNRARMKNPELKDGYIMDGYSLKDVDKIEKRNEDGSYTTIYDSSNDSGKKEVLNTDVFNKNTESPDRISEEKDEWGQPLVKASDGSVDFGKIDDGYGLQSAPIRLSLGENKKNPETGKDEGYGLLHIIARHGDQIRKAGYKSVQDFVEAVAKGYTEIREGVQVGATQTYLIVKKDDHANTLYIELSRDGKYWNINSAGIFKEKYVNRKKEITPEPTVGSSTSTDTTGVNHGTTEGAAVTSGNSPVISNGKDTNNSSNGNENNTSLTFEDGSPVPMVKDSKGRLTPDYANMKPEQAAEILTGQFGESAEKVVDGQIKKAEKAVKDANKMKVNYEGEPNDILEQEAIKKQTVGAAQKQLEHAQAIKKAMTAKKVADTVAKQEGEKPVDGANQAGSVAAEKFQKATRLVGNKRSRTLPNNEKIKGHYEIVPAESLTPSHDATNGYKKSEGFPVDKEGRTTNDRDYENDKMAQQSTDQIALKYNGQAIEQVPVVSDEGIVYDGNGRTMAGQKAAKDGTDGEYVNELLENAENFGFTREQIEKSGIEHPRLVLVTDERMPYTTETFAKFNRNEKKTQNNTEQAVAKSKTLSPEDVGSIVSEIEGSGSLEAFFNNPNAISSLWKTLQEKGVIGLNEVAGLQDMPGVPNAQGKEFIKNLVLGAMFKPETIRMMGIDSAVKTKVIGGIRAIMDNSKLGDYALGDEIEGAIRLLYEARSNKMSVGDLLRSSDFVNGNARDRFSQISQALAQALEGKASLFRELMSEYNDVARNYDTKEGSFGFYEHLDKEDLIKQFIQKSKVINDNNNKIKLYGEEGRITEKKGSDVSSGDGQHQEETGGSVGEDAATAAKQQQQVDEAVKKIATEITKQTGVTVHTNEKESQKALKDAEATDSNIKYHKETDEAVLDELNSGKTIKAYRAMQVIDGKLYPPMAASVGGKMVEANELGTWVRADENPDLAIPDIDPKTGKQKVDPKTGEPKWKFKLDKGGKDATGKKATAINAAYNPYWHMSRSPLNDQFKSAWIRPNIVVVECEVPESELTSGYKAERAKDAVGEVDWKSGSVSGEVFKQTGRARKVILSRWCKPVRVLSDAEVAQRAKEFVGDVKVEIPENVLTPKQRIAFEGAGFKIGAPEKGVKKSEQIADALKAGLQIDNTVREHRDSRWAGGEVLGMDRLPDDVRMNPNELYSEISQYHGDYITRKLDKVPEDGTVSFFSAHDGKWYFYSADKDHSINILDAIPASRENYEEFKNKLKDYGFDGSSKAVREDMQEAGYTGRTDSDKLESFVRGGFAESNRLRTGDSGRRQETNGHRDSKSSDETGSKPMSESENGEIRQFRTKDGEVYGFVVDGEIHLDTKKMKPETPLHEYTHLWTSALQRVNPKEWENVKKLLDSVDGLKDEVQKLYPELKGDDLYDEMLATYSGREGTKKLEETAERLAAEEGKSLEDSAKAKSFLGKVKEALKKYWNGVADMLHINFTSAEEVADKVLADWASGVNPNEIKAEEKFEPKKRTGWDRLKELSKMTPEQRAAEEEKGRKEYEAEKRAKIQEKYEAEKDAFKNEQNNEYADVLRESKIPEEAAEKFRKMAAEKRAVAADWSSRKYKKNNTAIDSHDIYGEEKTTTISAANERRRKAAVSNALEAAKDYDDFADTILNRCGLPKDAVPKIEEKPTFMPKEQKPANPIEKAAEDYKKEHPLTEEEVTSTTVFDDLPEDQKQYCIDAALDYLHGEDTSAISEAYYRNIYEKREPKRSQPKVEEKKEVSANPLEGLKNAAESYESEKKAEVPKPHSVEAKKQTRKELEAEKDAADNEFEAFMKELQKKRRSQFNSGFIDQNLIEAAPKMFSLAAKCAYSRIKLGMYDAKEVIKDLQKRFKEAFDGFDKNDVDLFYSQIMGQKWRDGDKRMSLNDWAEHYRKLSPEHQEKLVGDSKTAEERKQREESFISNLKMIMGGRKVDGIRELRQLAKELGLEGVKDTDLQELAETAVVSRARDIANSKAMSPERKFHEIKKLYENQPSLNQRDSDRVANQQYSTPAPYAYLADMYVKGNGKEINSALEPSAGNGMLTIGLPMDKVHVNDIDEARLMNLHRQGFKTITSQDGTQPFVDKNVDVVVTNPPFGTATPKDYDGYKISSLEGQMAINALESMKDDGRAAIIIGGKTEYAKNGSLNPKDKAFLGYLYSHYNVEDVINVDGSLYAKQGTTYPTRIILINGRRLDENSFPPVKDKARAETVKDYDELYKRIKDDILRGRGMDSSIGDRAESARPESDRQGSMDSDAKGVRPTGGRGSKPEDSVLPDGLHKEPSVSRSDDAMGGERGAEREAEGELFGGTSGTDGTRTDASQSEGRAANTNDVRVSESGGTGRLDTKRNDDGTSISGSRGRLAVNKKKEEKRELSSEKVNYTPKSGNPFTLQSVMPADQQEAVNKNLAKLGDADQFLVDELGYNDKDDLYSHLAAEQVDSVALAIHQAKQGNAFIIGDMTGIGKGRQAASLIRYAKKQGQIPVYFTKTAGLLSDVYRDLVDIGSPDLRPFVFGSSKEAKITDSDGNVVFALPKDKEVKRVLDYVSKYGKLPKEYDYVLTTYSQVGNGIYEYNDSGERKVKKTLKDKEPDSAAINGQKRRDAVERLMENGYLILDESHTAGGDSGQGNYFQHIIQKAKNVTFFSATFAKRPDNMPIYSLRTAMNQGGLKPSELIDAVKRGGATLQEIMSQTLTECGQMIRRERDMTGVTIDWKAIEDPVVVQEQREQYDSIIGLFNDIIDFQRTYVSKYVEERNNELAAIQASMSIKKGTAALGIKNQPFASKAYNTVQQVLLSLKAKTAAERAIDYLKQGIKPVIALSNTNESQTDKLPVGEEIDAPDLGTSLKKGLEGTLRYTKGDAKDNKESGYINLTDLGEDAVTAYHNLEEKIAKTSTGLPLSPIDVIKNELQKAGYKVGELTGRSTEFVYNENGTVSKVKREDTDKKKLAREFNDGEIDALILNKSAATGISLHASNKFKDQRKRVMIVAQQQSDVNDEVQMRGRIDRTGQVSRGAYEYVVSQIPAEQRLLMMFKAKLKSLDANTTSSQKSKFNEMDVADITNKYGDKVVREYAVEHLDLYSKMADPFGWEKDDLDLSTVDPQKLINSKGGRGGESEPGNDASKFLGRMALLKVSEQEKVLKEIGDLYKNEINRLNEMSENDLEITELPLKAKTIGKEVWKEGSEPNGDNAFADNTYIEKVNMAILKKPMKGEDVKKAQEGLTGGRSWDEYRDEKKTALKEYFGKKIAEEKERLHGRAMKLAKKAADKYGKEAKKNQETNHLTDEQIEKNTQFQYDNVYNEEKKKAETVIKNIETKYQAFDRVLDTFNTEDVYVLPSDMNNPNEMSSFGNSYGRLIDIKITDNYSPTASTVSFATLDGRRKITFPIHGLVGSGDKRVDVISTIYRLTKQAEAMSDENYRVVNMSIDNWDRFISNESRKDGYIITGNLMQALIDTKAQGLGGQLVKYTTDTGEVKTGILMPDRFKPTDAATEKFMSAKADDFMSGKIDDVVSSDGSVKLSSISNWRGTTIELRVPKSKAKGGKYFLDEELRSLVDGNDFHTKGNAMVANVQLDKVRDVLDRLSSLGVKVREERKGGTHFRTGNTNASVSPDAPVVVKNVDKLSKKLGSPINMVNSPEEVTNPAVKERLDKGENVTGWYDEKTGEVHLYMPNIHDTYTAEKTIWHETVGHKGMRGLFGDKFDDFLRSIYYDLDKPENAELKKLVDEERKYNPLNIYDAIEEGIARLAEDGKGEVGFWNTIKNKVTDILHEIGYRIAPNTKDVKYLLWLSKNLQKNPNSAYWKLKANAVRERIARENTPAVVEHEGFFGNNGGKPYDSILDLNHREFEQATDGKVHFRTSPSTASKIEEYNRRLGTAWYAFKESTVDNMQSLQEAMEIISGEKDVWREIPSSFNPLQAANRMDSVVQQVAERYDADFTKPLDDVFKKAVSLMDGSDGLEQMRNFNLYMIKKHGLERNRVFFVRDSIREMSADESNKSKADALRQDWMQEREDLRKELESGNIRLDEYFGKMDEWIRDNVDKDFLADEHDYSGFHQLQKVDKNDAYDDKQIIDDVMSAEDRLGDIAKDFWEKKKAATDYIADIEYTNGFIDKNSREHLKNMFDWYVPLRKFDDKTAEDVYGYITNQGDASSYIGPVIADAGGRYSLSDVNILAQISAMAKSSIVNGGKNVVKQHLARFVSAYEGGDKSDRIFLEIKPWAEKHTVDGNDVWVEATPQIPENATQEQISDILQQFESDMEAKKANGEAKLLNKRADAGFRFQRAKDKSEHLVEVYVAGKKRTFFCQGNPRVAQAINGLLNDSGTANKVSEKAASINRFCAQLNTSYNPEFIVSNMLRDLTTASANLTKEGAGYVKDFAKEYSSNFLSFWRGGNDENYWTMFKKYRNGTLNTNNDKERYFKEFMENGGQTGYVHVQALDKLIREYEHLIKNGEKDTHNWLVRQMSSKGGFIEAANEIIENLARFSTYTVSRQRGRSIGRSIYDAKEVSTNFNRHGSGDAIKTLKTASDTKFDTAFRGGMGWFNSWMRNHTMFYNAGIQGANMYVKNFKYAPKTTLVSFCAMPMALNMALAFFNEWMINSEDEKERNGVKDPYAELPEWKRRGNICIYTGKGHFKTIPLGIELRAFYGLGDIAMGFINPRLKSDTPIGYDILGQVSQIVPMGDFFGHHAPANDAMGVAKDAVLTVAPTVLKPMLELAANRDWTGRPIYNDGSYLDKAPRWKRAYNSTNDGYITLNKWANMATNGMDRSNPNLKGADWADVISAPYGVQHIVDGYLGGAYSTMARATSLGYKIGKYGVQKFKGDPKAEETSNSIDGNQVPFYRVFNYTPSEGSSMQRTKSKWYNYASELKQLEYNRSQMQKNVSSSVVDNLKNAAEIDKFDKSVDGQRVQIYSLANDYISKMKSDLKKVSDPETAKSINIKINQKMQEAVEDLDKLND